MKQGGVLKLRSVQRVPTPSLCGWGFRTQGVGEIHPPPSFISWWCALFLDNSRVGVHNLAWAAGKASQLNSPVDLVHQFGDSASGPVSKRNILKGVLFDSLSSPLRRIAVGDDQDMIPVSVARSDTLPAILKPLNGCRGMN